MTMQNKEHDELRAALREDQLDSVDDDALSVLVGEYSDSDIDDIETVMDADEDEEIINDLPDDVELLAKNIAEECQGVDEEGIPKSATSFVLEMINPYLDTRRTITQGAGVTPVLSIATRDEYVELCYDFKTKSSPELRSMWSTIERYGDINDSCDYETELPHLVFVIVPISAYGTYYMTAESPISWALQPKIPGEDACQIKILFEADNIGFYETDDIDMDDVVGDVIRDIEEDYKYQEQVLAQQLQNEEAKTKEDKILNGGFYE